MNTYRTFGPLGLVILLFGLLSGLVTGTWSSFYVLVHLILGGMMLGLYLFTHVDTLRDSVGGRQAKYGTNAVVYTLLTVGVIVAVNYVAAQREWRWDVTEQQMFSLAPQTLQVLGDLGGEVVVTGFFREGEEGAAEDLLESYAAESELFSFEFVDPDKRPELAQQFDISQFGTLHIATSGDSTKITQATEEEITNTLIRLTASERRRIYYVSGHGQPDLETAGDVAGYSSAKAALENEGYSIEPLLLAELPDVPQDADMLIVAATDRPMLPREVEAIDRYIARGGRTLLMLDPQQGDELLPLLESRGLGVGNDVIIEQYVQLFSGAQLGVEPIISDYGSHPITAGFNQRTIFSMARSLRPSETAPDGIAWTALARTSPSPNSWGETDLTRLFETNEVEEGEGDLPGPITLAAAATLGEAALNWTASAVSTVSTDGGAVAATDDEATAPTGLEGRLVVVGDSEWLNNRYLGNFYNQDLFLNTVGWLAGEEERIAIRPRGTRASQVMLTQQESTAVFYLTVLLLPELVLLGGLLIWYGRRYR